MRDLVWMRITESEGLCLVSLRTLRLLGYERVYLPLGRYTLSYPRGRLVPVYSMVIRWTTAALASFLSHVGICKTEASEYVLIHGSQSVLVCKGQVRLLHCEIGVEITNITRRFLKKKSINCI